VKALIRKAVLKDSEAMARLDERCFSLPWSRQAFHNELANPAGFYLVAALDDEIIGYAGQWKVIDEGHITNVAVDPSHRNKGIGELLLRQLIEISREDGIYSHTLEVRVSNESAIGLYNKLGFKIAGIRKEYYSDNLEDALILWRKPQ
jgi:ribosomal-protein-alanine N-acetyltransferase